MKNKIAIKYCFGLLTTIIMFHIVYSFFLSQVTQRIYHHRMLNVRKFDNQSLKYVNWRSVILSFLESNKKNTSKPIIVIVGSSFSWGHSWQEDKIYSYKLQEKLGDYKIINLSIIGGSAGTYLYILKAMQKLNLNVSKIIIETNLLNAYAKSPVTTEIFEKMKFLETADLLLPPYMFLYLTNFFGFDAYNIIQDEYNYEQKERTFSKGNLPKENFQNMDEFSNTLTFSKESFRKIFDLAIALADDVYFITAPLARDGIPDVINPEVLLEQMTEIYQLCHQHKNIHCKNFGLDNRKENFVDMSHLNILGHEVYSDSFLNMLNTARHIDNQL